MGNGSSSGDKIAKVIDAQGKPRKVKLPVKAAEIMLEEPGHIICGVEELKRARRVVAMRADDELSGGKVYVLVPIGRIHCRVTDADMVIIKAACCGRKKKISGAKVLPDVMVSEDEKYTNGIPHVSGHRFGNCRPWMPVLEPIPEVL
ncbi:Secretion-associated RAS super family 2 isoform 1 [Hibiscus syriacus]|uniref:Secretion-associated RAS super family 2 isoform 1 n=1 Tax=Hibiscus syriacus TaxID=106335 RepID=A0A6A3A290_HIBSY|nr:uncharacterized protein LOC120135383 [Hibiscus syriacus]KAE8697946.1 Secretion-associated RAS super family 2 isoform 1 [Hibiscus syriacus]